MKRFKVLMAVICACAMMISFAGAAFAGEAEGIDLETVYKMAQKALDQQAVENVMNRHVMYHCYGLHEDEVLALWVNEPENRATASFGQNQGFFVGWDAIWEGYVVSHTESWLDRAKSYCEEKGIDVSGMTDEEILDVYGGVGQFLMHYTTTAIIEIADDGQTAKGFWYSPGMVKETGEAAQTLWEAYGCDFVKENGEWKIWHLHMFTDFSGEFFVDLGGEAMTASMPDGDSSGESAEGESAEGELPEGELPEGESAEGESASDSGEAEAAEGADNAAVVEGGEALALQKVNSYLYSAEYTMFSEDRLRSEMELVVPLPYEKWSFDEPNYGPTKEQWESYGVDLDAWYAAHAS